MDAFVSAVLGDLASRTLSFIIDRLYCRQVVVEEDLECLRSLLLRIQTIVKEAEGRHITNQAMLQQLQMLREWMYEGNYLLDTFKYQMLQPEGVNDEVSDNSFALSKLSRRKQLYLSTTTINMPFDLEEIKKVEQMLGSLKSIIGDMKEFVTFLKGYPPLCREPYSKHLVLDKCMFGRQSEMERIVNFLLQEEPLGVESLGVLPIIGPARVGKSTLVEYVCYDERVRNYFSSIVSFNGSDIESRNLADIRDSGVLKHSSGASATHERLLIIIEFLEDAVLDEERWRGLCSSRNFMPPGSKIIITSRSERFINLGTVQPLVLKQLPREAFWYFFKVIAFGSTNPEEHPLLAVSNVILTLASIGMEIAVELNGSFTGANIAGALLRANFCIKFWRRMLKYHRDCTERHLILFGEHPHTLLQKNQHIYLWGIPPASQLFIVRDYKTHPSNKDFPKVMLLDVQTGSAKPHGKFEVLAWRSHIPPYHDYVMSCESRACKKRSRQKDV
ncbi:disease resistance protein RGA2-like [Phragmites australis]|uniref:disease resistance protein RGA2-like n=1 Tax=Phragmites australis TaxID=29695 RepID=UPI002D790FF9|nr:disease resistance protein RGA2-like [Phragmites australis]